MINVGNEGLQHTATNYKANKKLIILRDVIKNSGRENKRIIHPQELHSNLESLRGGTVGGIRQSFIRC